MTKKPCIRLEREHDDSRRAVIYSLRGKLIGNPECYEFLEDAQEQIQEGYINVVLQLQDMEWCNSTGVGLIAAIYTSSLDQGGRVFMVATPDRVQHLLELSNLWQFLVPCDTLADVQIDPAADGE